MKELLKKFHFRNDRFIVLQVLLDGNQELKVVECLEVSIENEDLNFSPFETSPDQESYLNQFRDVPVLVHVVNENVIWKTISTKGLNRDDLAGNVLPGAEPDDFIILHTEQEDTLTVALFRNKEAQLVVDQLQQYDFILLALSWGPVVGQLALENATAESIDFKSLCNLTEAQSDNLNNLSNDQSTGELVATIDGQKLNLGQILLLGTALAYMSNSSGIRILENGISELKFKSWAINTVRYATVILLPLMIGLLGVKWYVDSKNNHLYSQYAVHSQTITRLNQLNDNLERNLNLLSQTGIDKQIESAYCLDRIGESLPQQITLTKCYVYPVKSTINRNEPVEIDYSSIEIEGNSPDTDVLNNWVNTLESMQWIDRVVIVNYLQEMSVGGSFKLKLSIRT